ncbi:hypothetical protein ACJRO7_008812 [Eucalyptus globulus]|uniref:Uncharacterized protein n=1 Tax=Eucalyptus globulus TaxID=34317 RepID=A0ABD3IUA7_EUCGL
MLSHSLTLSDQLTVDGSTTELLRDNWRFGRVQQSLSSRIGGENHDRDMVKGIGVSTSPWMEAAPALLVPARDRNLRHTELETIAEDQEDEDLDDE